MAKQSKLELVLKFLSDKTGISQAQSEIGVLVEKIKNLKDAASKTFSFMKEAASTFFLPLRVLAIPAIAAVTSTFGLALKAVKEFAGQELGEADVKSALTAMGQYSVGYEKKIKHLADTYQETTGIADDMWLSSFAQLTRFGMTSGNVDKVAEAFKNLTGLMDGNPAAAADAMGRALQGEFSMFSRYGMKVEQTGDKVKDFDGLLTQINTRGKGALEDRADTLALKWQGVKNTAGDTLEAAGGKIAEGTGLAKWLDDVKKKIGELKTDFEKGGLGKALEEAAAKFSAKIKEGFDWIGELKTKFKESGQSLGEGIQGALQAALVVFGEALIATVKSTFGIWKAVGIVIFNAFKEEILKLNLPGMKGVREDSAKAAAAAMTPEEAKASLVKTGLRTPEKMAEQEKSLGAIRWNDVLASEVGGLSKDQQAAIAASGSSRAIDSAISQTVTDQAGIWSGFGGRAVGAVESAAMGGKTPQAGAPAQNPAMADAQKYQKQADSFSNMAGQLGDSKEGDAAKKLAEEAQKKATELMGQIETLSGSTDESMKTSQKALESIKETNTLSLTALNSLVTSSSELTTALGAQQNRIDSLAAKIADLQRRINGMTSAVSAVRS